MAQQRCKVFVAVRKDEFLLRDGMHSEVLATFMCSTVRLPVCHTLNRNG